MKRQLKKSVVYSLYVISFSFLLIGVIGITASVGKLATKKPNPEYQYVSKGILDYEERTPVISIDTKIVRPYVDGNVKLVKNFYDYKDDASTQEKSLIYYEGIYMPSSGVSYSNGEIFDIIAIYDGKVKEVKEDSTLGNIVTIGHENGLISIYQSISDISVKENDVVTKGQTIAKSSTSNISKDLGNHLYFELIKDGISVNPENYYDKSINEL